MPGRGMGLVRDEGQLGTVSARAVRPRAVRSS